MLGLLQCITQIPDPSVKLLSTLNNWFATHLDGECLFDSIYREVYLIHKFQIYIYIYAVYLSTALKCIFPIRNILIMRILAPFWRRFHCLNWETEFNGDFDQRIVCCLGSSIAPIPHCCSVPPIPSSNNLGTILPQNCDNLVIQGK